MRRETVWWTKSNFLGLFPKTVEDQWDCEIANYYIALPLQHLSPFEYPYFFWAIFPQIFWTLLGYTVAKAPASPRNLTWFTRPLLLLRGWGLGTRLLKHVLWLCTTYSLTAFIHSRSLWTAMARRSAKLVYPSCVESHFKTRLIWIISYSC